MATIIPAPKGTTVTPTPYTFLDLTQAQDLAGEGAQLRQLVQTFEVSLAEEMQKMSRALSANDQHAVEFSLHTLKGFMGIFVVPTLAFQIELLYKNCRSQPLAATATKFNSLVPNLDDLLSEVRGWLRL